MKNKKCAASVAFALLCTLIFTFLLDFIPSYASSGAVDSMGNNSSEEQIDSAEILEFFLGQELCTAEREYLILVGGEDISYSAGVNTSFVEIEYNHDLNNLRVFAREYSFSSGAALLSFVPASASVAGASGDITSSLTKQSDGRYYAYFDEVYDTTDTAVVRVNYTLSLPISEQSANRLLNLAYTDAALIKAEYDSRLADYTAAKAAYDEYLRLFSEYEIEREEYLEYVSALEIYEEKRLEYEKYLAEYAEYLASRELWEKYESDLAKYKEDLSLYADYVNKQEIYLAELAKYNSYLSRLEACEFKLSAVELLNTKMSSLNRTAKAAIEGGLVDTVLAERDTLESSLVGAPPLVIDMAGDSTVALRQIMKDYFSLETEGARYAYYVKNYEAIKKSVTELFISLDYLYSNSTIRATIIEMEKDEKYRILLAQLYLTSMALCDEPLLSVPRDMVLGSSGSASYKQFTYTADYKTAGGYTVSQILGKTDYLTDKNMARPMENDEGWPAAVNQPTPPTPVSAPTMPTAPARPVLPDTVADPGDAPREVNEPTLPTAVSNPGEVPTLPMHEQAIVDALEAGELTLRDTAFNEPRTMLIKRSVDKKYVNEELATVRFFSRVGGEELYSTRVDLGDSVYYDAPLPEKAEDSGYTYSFDSWKTADGIAVSLKEIHGSVNLYPSFKATKKIFEITWNIDGEVIKSHVPYGDIPTCPVHPERASEGGYEYTFSGWNKPVAPVTEAAEYRARFSKEYIVKHGFGGATVSQDEGGGLVFDFGSVYDTDYDLKSVLEYADGQYAVTIKTGYFDMNISKSNAKRLVDSGAARLTVRISKRTGESSYLIRIFDSEGAEISCDAKFTLTADSGLSYTDATISRITLTTGDAEGGVRYGKFTLDGGKISFSAGFGVQYRLSFEYKLNAVSHSMITLSAEKEIYTAGELVMFEYEVAEGAFLYGLYYENSSGERTRLSGTSFTMPEEDINLIAEVKYLEYKITFVSDGAVVETQYLKLGEVPTSPETPLKAASETHTYRFLGWSEELVPATEDKVYHAVFEEIPIEDAPEAEGNEGLTLYEKIMLIALLGVPCAAVALVFVFAKFRR